MVKGEVVFQHLYDIGMEIDLSKVEKVSNRLPAEQEFKTEKVTPKYITLHPAPLILKLNPLKAKVFDSEVQIKRSVRIYSVGAISIELRVPFSCPLHELTQYAHAFDIEVGERRTTVFGISDEACEKIKSSLGGCIISPHAEHGVPEDYTVFCISECDKPEEFFARNKKTIAAILRGEKMAEKLSGEEVEDASKLWLSYYPEDFIVVDWSAALLVEPSGKYEDMLLVAELANLQLLELRTYDRILDKKSDVMYDDLKAIMGRGGLILGSGKLERVMFDLAKLRIEITDVVDETMNITKFIGDWYLAKLHFYLSERLHLNDWYSSVMRKLENLEGLYTMASDRSEMQKGTMLELLIVFLIVFEIVLAFAGKV